MKSLRIAVFQMNIIWEDQTANFKQLEEKMASLKGEEIDIIFLPEMSFTGFSMNIGRTGDSENKTIIKIGELAQKNGVAIGFGWTKMMNGRGENHYSVVGKEGILLSDYIKIHPFSFAHENEYFNAGNHLSFFEINKVPMSTFICYDLRFPEIFQIASDRAHIIAVPANWPAKRAEHWDILLKARAIENQVYVVAVNCIGNINGQDYHGGSVVVNPNGTVIASREKEGFFICDICDDVDVYREQFPVRKDRRNEQYHLLKV